MGKAKYYIGVDGGGTGTRLRVTDSSGALIANGKGPASALGLGIEKSWAAIIETLNDTVKDIKLKDCHLGAGLSGINNSNWKKDFLKANPGFGKVIAKSDGFTTLLGAHNDNPGIIIALGTGSIGMSKDKLGKIHSVSGWGYPAGDEASGSWLGIQSVRYTEKVLDGRVGASPLSDLVRKRCGSNPNEFLKWLGNATQTDYASLAPLVFSVVSDDLFAKELVEKALNDIEEMVLAIDKSKELPIVMCGKLGEHFLNFLPDHILKRCIPGIGSSVDGALMLLKDNK
jgi:glucosamine kinase